MASQAQVDLIISTAGTLPQLERELEAIIQAAEAGADDVDIEASLNRQEAVRGLIDDLNDVVSQASIFTPDVEIQATLDVLDSLNDIDAELDNLIFEAEQRAAAIQLEAEIDADIAQLDAELAALVGELEASAPEIDLEVDVDRDGRASRAFAGIGRAAASALPSIAGLASGVGKMGLAVGAAAPLMAGLVVAIESILPAAAVAVTGMIAVQLAAGTVKLAMQGVGDAVKTAFDPEATPQELAEAMEKLAPSARSFVTELRKLQPEFKKLQQQVQENFFKGFDNALKNLSSTALPLVSNALKKTSVTLNEMALGAADAAVKLSQDGVLGKALDGATKGLSNLTKVPGQAVTALGQLGAAAAPAFDRITKAAANSATKISDKLTKAFEDGRLERAIDKAIDVIAQLGRIAGNVFSGLGNIIDTVSGSGEGLFGIMEKVTKAFEDVTSTKGFQDALKALSETAGVLVDEGLELIVQALQLLGPIFVELGPPVQELIKLLGGSLGKIFEKLGPVLVKLAEAFGKLIPVLEPFVTLATDILVAILPGLIPLFETLGRVFEAAAPFAKQLADNIGAQLLPFLRKMAEEVLPKLLPFLGDLAEKIFPKLTEILAELEPFLVKIGESLGELLVKLIPLIIEFIKFQFALAEGLMPIFEPLIKLILLLAEGALSLLNSQIVNLIIPAIEILTLLLQGKFSEAWEKAKEVIKNMGEKVVKYVEGFVQGIIDSLNRAAAAVAEKAQQMATDLITRVRHGVEDTVRNFQSLPERAAQSLADSGTALVRAGADMVQGFIDGIISMIPSLESAANRIADIAADVVKSTLGIHSPSTVMREVGNDTMDGYLLGLADRIPELRKELEGVANLAPSFALPNGQRLTLPQSGTSAPSVQVFIGNEEFNGHIDTRVSQSNTARDRLAITGVRR